MKVSRVQIIQRGLSNRCPNCGGRTLFRTGTLFDLNKACPTCGLKLERDEGFFLGSLSLNYGVTVIVFLLPVLLLAIAGVIDGTTAFILAGVGAVGFPVLFYRSSRSWWLMAYYYFLPHHLPANQRPIAEGEDGNT
ncbi:MAG: TFIIB-type zinc ribbon-containing protein [Opitutaceae bacterium]|nr:TFIIB-type zinc ribbon-containing protein [Opitutaceae bacterium]